MHPLLLRIIIILVAILAGIIILRIVGRRGGYGGYGGYGGSSRKWYGNATDMLKRRGDLISREKVKEKITKQTEALNKHIRRLDNYAETILRELESSSTTKIQKIDYILAILQGLIETQKTIVELGKEYKRLRGSDSDLGFRDRKLIDNAEAKVNNLTSLILERLPHMSEDIMKEIEEAVQLLKTLKEEDAEEEAEVSVEETIKIVEIRELHEQYRALHEALRSGREHRAKDINRVIDDLKDQLGLEEKELKLDLAEDRDFRVEELIDKKVKNILVRQLHQIHETIKKVHDAHQLVGEPKKRLDEFHSVRKILDQLLDESHYEQEVLQRMEIIEHKTKKIEAKKKPVEREEEATIHKTTADEGAEEAEEREEDLVGAGV